MQQQLSFGDEPARDAALAQVTHETFRGKAMDWLRDLPMGWTGTGEDLRVLMTNRGIVPHHHNAWGALIMQAVKARLLYHTGQWRKMQAPGSHARRTPVYRRG